MKKQILFLAIFLTAGIFMFPGCCDAPDDDAPDFCSEEGVITGIDFRLCPCCGGWFIEIGNDTLRATVLPEGFGESLDPSEFPLPVFLEWSVPVTLCTGDEIIVDCIRRR